MHKGERWIEVALNLLCHTGEASSPRYHTKIGRYSYTLSFDHHCVVRKSQ